MTANVIPFSPTRRPPAKPEWVERIRAYAMQTWTAPTAPGGLPVAPAVPAPREEEILQLLRRIDRRLARLTTVRESTPAARRNPPRKMPRTVVKTSIKWGQLFARVPQ